MLLIEAKDLSGRKVILTLNIDPNGKAEIRLWTPKPSVGPFAGDLQASAVLSARDQAELRRSL